jgi:hypothetical protein
MYKQKRKYDRTIGRKQNWGKEIGWISCTPLGGGAAALARTKLTHGQGDRQSCRGKQKHDVDRTRAQI